MPVWYTRGQYGSKFCWKPRVVKDLAMRESAWGSWSVIGLDCLLQIFLSVMFMGCEVEHIESGRLAQLV
jgi:hypothetical protein